MTNDSTATGLIEVHDSGSGYETNSTHQSETTSLTSSIQQWIVQSGRRYHAYYGPDKNLMPTDEVEQERLDIHHEIMLLIAGGDLSKAPVKNPRKVLDIGTGTAPSGQIGFLRIGNSAIPLSTATYLTSASRFEVDDFELEWTYQKGSFDFIHGRNMAHSIKKWSTVLSEVIRQHLLIDVVHPVTSSLPPKHLIEIGIQAMEILGRIIPTAEWMEKLLVDAGFVDVEVKTYKQPLGPWPKQKDLKQAELLCALASKDTYHSYGMSVLTRGLGWSAEDADALCTAAHAAQSDQNPEFTRTPSCELNYHKVLSSG